MNYKILIIVLITILFLISLGGMAMNEDKEYIIDKNQEFWKDKLSDEQYNVLVEGGTELACQNKYYNNKRKGLYVCAACNNILFSSAEKYSSGSGWPSFYDVQDENAIGTRKDKSLGMERTEIFCNRCGGHLGHVFSDGPQPTGLRYCINSDALRFLQEASFALGCFWTPDALFGSIEGVYFVEVGYAGGEMENPTYHNLGKHAETVYVTYDPELVSYQDLLDVFWNHHSPTTEAYTGQYRSIIFYNSDEQKKQAEKYLKNKETEVKSDIYTEITEIESFNSAEDYHQKYLLKRNVNLYDGVKSIFDNEKEFDKSKLAVKLNAYNSGFLSEQQIKKYLKSHYKYVNYEDVIEKIISDLNELK